MVRARYRQDDSEVPSPKPFKKLSMFMPGLEEDVSKEIEDIVGADSFEWVEYGECVTFDDEVSDEELEPELEE